MFGVATEFLHDDVAIDVMVSLWEYDCSECLSNDAYGCCRDDEPREDEVETLLALFLYRQELWWLDVGDCCLARRCPECVDLELDFFLDTTAPMLIYTIMKWEEKKGEEKRRERIMVDKFSLYIWICKNLYTSTTSTIKSPYYCCLHSEHRSQSSIFNGVDGIQISLPCTTRFTFESKPHLSKHDP